MTLMTHARDFVNISVYNSFIFNRISPWPAYIGAGTFELWTIENKREYCMHIYCVVQYRF